MTLRQRSATILTLSAVIGGTTGFGMAHALAWAPAYELEMRIVAVHDVPRSGVGECRLTVDVVRVIRLMHSQPGFPPSRMDVTVPCAARGSWRVTPNPFDQRIQVQDLRVGRQFSAGLNTRLSIIVSTIRGS